MGVDGAKPKSYVQRTPRGALQVVFPTCVFRATQKPSNLVVRLIFEAGIGTGMAGIPWVSILALTDPSGAPQVVFPCVPFGPRVGGGFRTP